MSKYIVYFDSGTSNTRIYLLNKKFDVLYVNQKSVGSKDSAILGSNEILLKGLKELYDKLLFEYNIEEFDIQDVYASGMITSPYGMIEVPHIQVPITIEEFCNSVYCHFEGKYFNRNIYLIPGLKTVDSDFTFVNNMRGEEIEVVGAIHELKDKCGGDSFAMILPGSHTHVTYIEKDKIAGIISNFTGELFHALKEQTIMSPVLSAEVKELDKDMVKKGMDNLETFGINRSLYIAHAMRIFNHGSEKERFSYAEGVINGGVRKSLEYFCEHFWHECSTIAIISNEFMYNLFSIIFQDSKYIKNIIWLPISKTKSYGVLGLKKIIETRGEDF